MSSKRVKLWLGAAAVGVAAVGLVTLGSARQAGASVQAQHRAAPVTQQVSLAIFRGHINGQRGVPGPDGKGHDTVVPANFTVKAGIPVRVTVINYDEGAHGIVARGLGLNAMIKPGKEVKDTEGANEEKTETVQPVTTTFTFTAKHKGVYRWYCPLPCDKGANYWAMGRGYGGMGKEGFMAGYIVAT